MLRNTGGTTPGRKFEISFLIYSDCICIDEIPKYIYSILDCMYRENWNDNYWFQIRVLYCFFGNVLISGTGMLLKLIVSYIDKCRRKPRIHIHSRTTYFIDFTSNDTRKISKPSKFPRFILLNNFVKMKLIY